jgi:hypothetical protein
MALFERIVVQLFSEFSQARKAIIAHRSCVEIPASALVCVDVQGQELRRLRDSSSSYPKRKLLKSHFKPKGR